MAKRLRTKVLGEIMILKKAEAIMLRLFRYQIITIRTLQGNRISSYLSSSLKYLWRSLIYKVALR
ncbi:hypothetical protein HQ43_02795 [Porphyromonas canoris]|uniref:Uncharacterized protein n=1 Tax=Porphyromonas canoris TaxID=36875 RepID=A0ABR4XM68_9PORP|nr:hypothetical protein HQ43_02795 [Porphyromonas canoris]